MELAVDTGEVPGIGAASADGLQGPVSPDMEQPYKRPRQDDYNDIQHKIQNNFDKASENLESDMSLNEENLQETTEETVTFAKVTTGQVIDLSANVIGADRDLDTDNDKNVDVEMMSPVHETIQRFNSASDLTAISPFVTSPKQWRESPLYGSASDISVGKASVDSQDGQVHEAPADLIHAVTDSTGDGDDVYPIKPSAVRRSNSWRNLSRPTVQKRDTDDPMLERLRSNSLTSDAQVDKSEPQTSVLFENISVETPDTTLIRPSKLRESLRKKKRDSTGSRSPYISASSEGFTPDKSSGTSAKHSLQLSSTDTDTNGEVNLSQSHNAQLKMKNSISENSPMPVIKGTPGTKEQGTKSRLRKLCADSMLTSSLPSPHKISPAKHQQDTVSVIRYQTGVLFGILCSVKFTNNNNTITLYLYILWDIEFKCGVVKALMN